MFVTSLHCFYRASTSVGKRRLPLRKGLSTSEGEVVGSTLLRSSAEGAAAGTPAAAEVGTPAGERSPAGEVAGTVEAGQGRRWEGRARTLRVARTWACLRVGRSNLQWRERMVVN